jgi:hypothetical protein
MPILLRPVGEDRYIVVGDTYTHGFCDAEAVVGQLEEPWIIRVTIVGDDSEFRPTYYNTATNTTVYEDPRLGPLPPPWVAIPKNVDEEPYPWRTIFRNSDTGEEMEFDPRLLPESLRARGVPLRTFHLV